MKNEGENQSGLNLKAARSDDQIDLMKRIIADDVCPFCREHLEKYHPKPILFETSNWVVTLNAFPYNMTQKHYLIIAKQHLKHSAEIKPEGWSEIGKIIKKLEKEEGLDYGTMLMRFGNMDKTGATVKHLHFQLVQSDPNHPNYDPKTGLAVRVG